MFSCSNWVLSDVQRFWGFSIVVFLRDFSVF